MRQIQPNEPPPALLGIQFCPKLLQRFRQSLLQVISSEDQLNQVHGLDLQEIQCDDRQLIR